MIQQAERFDVWLVIIGIAMFYYADTEKRSAYVHNTKKDILNYQIQQYKERIQHIELVLSEYSQFKRSGLKLTDLSQLLRDNKQAFLSATAGVPQAPDMPKQFYSKEFVSEYIASEQGWEIICTALGFNNPVPEDYYNFSRDMYCQLEPEGTLKSSFLAQAKSDRIRLVELHTELSDWEPYDAESEMVLQGIILLAWPYILMFAAQLKLFLLWHSAKNKRSHVELNGSTYIVRVKEKG
ncbi:MULTISPECIES: hypothetical protein [unclassified Vibrio]|uniref:hypothetical protein n=1 Tax=unclassified Vibrio TaxID=2614977 RepID=UPI0029649378|nr:MULTISPECIES: hypothetical protein [unclassified Vibrio]MDW2100512.1 hypothetical protein [Vibrio sp. 1580]MDW2275593.1 hypothetical protein [Vibrio sp. 1074]MDW2287419.1 hypothetical protein [Vibrio sp. 1562]